MAPMRLFCLRIGSRRKLYIIATSHDEAWDKVAANVDAAETHDVWWSLDEIPAIW